MTEVRLGGKLLTDEEVAIAVDLGLFESNRAERLKEKAEEEDVLAAHVMTPAAVAVESSFSQPTEENAVKDTESMDFDAQMQCYADAIAAQGGYVPCSSAARVIGLVL